MEEQFKKYQIEQKSKGGQLDIDDICEAHTCKKFVQICINKIEKLSDGTLRYSGLDSKGGQRINFRRDDLRFLK